MIHQFAPGVHKIEPDRYFNDPALRWHLSSTIGRVLINQSPAHALAAMGEHKATKAFAIGSAAHSRVLGVGQDIAVMPDELLSDDGGIRTKAAKEWKASREEEGMIVLKRDQAAQIDAIAQSVTGHLADAGVILSPLCSELVVTAEIDGVKVKAMIDNAPADMPVLWDLKTTENAHPEAVVRSVVNYGYDFQAAHYIEAWKAATGEDRAFRFVFVEKAPPYAACIIELGAETLMMAGKKTRRARQIMAQCMTANDWPSYPPGVVRIDMPEWFYNRWLEREAAEYANGLMEDPSAEALRDAYLLQHPQGFAAE